jgi:hypothetical protein
VFFFSEYITSTTNYPERRKEWIHKITQIQRRGTLPGTSRPDSNTKPAIPDTRIHSRASTTAAAAVKKFLRKLNSFGITSNNSHSELEVPMTGTAAKLQKHLRSLTSPDTWPDGATLQFPIISPRGPSVFLMSRTHIAAALLGHLGWDEHGVMGELNLLFMGPPFVLKSIFAI